MPSAHTQMGGAVEVCPSAFLGQSDIANMMVRTTTAKDIAVSAILWIGFIGFSLVLVAPIGPAAFYRGRPATRFASLGSKLNLNVHLHNLLPDGVFTAEEDGAATFHELSGPKVEDLERILVRVIRRTQKDLHRRGLLDEPDPDDALARLHAEAV